MRQRHIRQKKPIVIYSKGYVITPISKSISVSEPDNQTVTVSQLTDSGGKLSRTVTGSKTPSTTGFNIGAYRCSNTVNLTEYSRLRVKGHANVDTGSTYGDNHYRCFFAALIPSTVSAIKVSEGGAYLAASGTPSASNQFTEERVGVSLGSSAVIDISLDISALSGSYCVYVALLLKASAATGTLQIDQIWIE